MRSLLIQGYLRHTRPAFPPEQVDHTWTYEWPERSREKDWEALPEFRTLQQVELAEKLCEVTEYCARLYRHRAKDFSPQFIQHPKTLAFQARVVCCAVPRQAQLRGHQHLSVRTCQLLGQQMHGPYEGIGRRPLRASVYEEPFQKF